MFWLGMVLGLFVGARLGVLVLALKLDGKHEQAKEVSC